MIGEVSTVNDDNTDNIIDIPRARFATIDEDTEPQRLLVSDYWPSQDCTVPICEGVRKDNAFGPAENRAFAPIIEEHDTQMGNVQLICRNEWSIWI